MNQTLTSHLPAPVAALSNMLLSPITGAIARLSTIRDFLMELPQHQKEFSTDLFSPGEYHLLGPSLPPRDSRYEVAESASHRNYFMVRETRHLALAAPGIVMVQERLVSSTKGDCPTPQFEIAGAPTRSDIIALARVTSYEDVKKLATMEISRRNENARTLSNNA